MKKNAGRQVTRSRQDLVIRSFFGLFFLALAIAILVLSTPANRMGSLFAAFIIGGLGIDELISLRLQRRSLLSRIGPLP
ncbi:hypothetical protein IQE94_05040 [Synechocystis sp. PCC 7339]|uniref:hypothetical protein n=1 Tax=unclassified Synechocystis TaxID=2640012 RepID=UPI001BAF3EAA|nr:MULTISPECIES: hypothetical protein [unclassified Synechocystis]QUS61479.1 hypothetical protein HTZ78_12965 [Synechocystis sp. PCC 7338]UAJ73655.1 hypothetical protein IQE94_05040 [Synechocystis sp. PCC 7339]